ncbi:hypothetical protein M378DRAFT_160898, partial [Amanita muscaria Koide BX008]
ESEGHRFRPIVDRLFQSLSLSLNRETSVTFKIVATSQHDCGTDDAGHYI